MNKLTVTLLFGFIISSSSFGQTITDLINEVNQDSLVKVIRAFSGEDATVVNGSTVTILNRVSNANDIAADYLKQKFAALSNLTINDQGYSINGRNIIATQLGKTNPNDIYIVCAHYDSVDNYCADDNASGSTAVLEIARILSTQCFDNTIIYALWDEEEDGLLGAAYYASQASGNGDNILGVLNLDMIAYDGDNDNDFDIDVRPIANSIAVNDAIISVLNTYGFNLNVNVVNPGTTSSDHSTFWNQGYSAVLLGESWFNGDQTPSYHTVADRVGTLNIPYYTEITKLSLAYMATVGNLLNVDNTVSITPSTLTANQTGATYQWLDCDNNNIAIPTETNQSFVPISNGNYAVQITSGSCIEISKCVNFSTLGILEFNEENIVVYPNPVSSLLNINVPNYNSVILKMVTIDGKELLNQPLEKLHNEIDLTQFSRGIYFVNIEAKGNTISFKIVKE